MFDDGPPIAAADAAGTMRYACRFRHPQATTAARRPLLVWIPGSGGSAQDVYDLTLLRQKASAYDLSGDPARPGYQLVSVQARNLHWMTPNAQDGPKHDFFQRDLASPSTNVDVANLDRLIDQVAQDGTVDAQRIYVMGWSNGAQFAQLYAVARHGTATPSGHHVAAAAIYSGADPFHNQPDQPIPSCQLDPYPKSSVPILVVSRACDVYACDEAQAAGLVSQGADVNPGAVVTTWMTDLVGKVGDLNGRWLLLSGMGTVTNVCTAPQQCDQDRAVKNHVRWPDGMAVGDGGRDHEPDMLDFLRDHPWP
jgi:poly(3-hydroxybutyrate) depolymerase